MPSHKLQLYRAQCGQIPLRIEQDFGPCDVAAALTKDRKVLTLGVMNPTEKELEFSPELAGATVNGLATRWCISGPSHMAHNTPGKARVVDIQKTDNVATSASLRVPPLSAALFRIPLK